VADLDTLHFTLDKAVDYALENNIEIEQLQVEFEKSQAQVGEALSAFYPSINARGGYTYITNIPVLEFEGMLMPMGQSENYSLSISLQQVIFSWGKIYNAYKISGIGKKITELNLVRKKQEVRYSVTDAFYGLLVLEEMVQLSKESLAQLKRHERAVETRYKAGLVPQFELLRAQVQVANLKPQVIEAEHGLKLAKEGFKMLLGMPLNNEFEVTGELKMADHAFNIEELIDYALNNRIELKNLKDVEKIAKLSQSIARRANLPTFVGGATYDYTKPFGFAGNEWGSNIIFNLGFEWPLFTGFKNLYQYKQAALAVKEAGLAFDNLEKAITLEVKKAYLNILAANELIVTAQENVGQAEKAFEIINTRYKNGLATNLEYMDAQLALMQAKTNCLAALKNYYTSKAEIYKAIGKEE
jgi:outer membrane protein TolC